MGTYRVLVRETNEAYYFVEADSEDEAKRAAEELEYADTEHLTTLTAEAIDVDRWDDDEDDEEEAA
jgi:DNA-dependent RNA polymerase auxiliary subunit epsilon